MLAPTKHIYALSMWSVEKRPTGWYFSKSAYHGRKHDWRGPYRTEFSVKLMIAREAPSGDQEKAQARRACEAPDRGTASAPPPLFGRPFAARSFGPPTPRECLAASLR
jgi:hypothetical protein